MAVQSDPLLPSQRQDFPVLGKIAQSSVARFPGHQRQDCTVTGRIAQSVTTRETDSVRQADLVVVLGSEAVELLGLSVVPPVLVLDIAVLEVHGPVAVLVALPP